MKRFIINYNDGEKGWVTADAYTQNSQFTRFFNKVKLPPYKIEQISIITDMIESIEEDRTFNDDVPEITDEP